MRRTRPVREDSPVARALPVALVLLGTLVLAYPALSAWVSEGSQSRAVQSYADVVDSRSEEELAAAWEEAETYNENLTGDPVHDPFVPGSGYALPDNYASVLNLGGDGVMATLEIPSIGLELPVYHGTSEEVLERGVGHVEQTPLPIGGEGRRCVLTGHRGLPSAELFTRLDELGEGDLVLLRVLGSTLAYRVYQTEVIEPDEISKLVAEPGRDLVTLVTCTPYGVNTHRLLVHCERTEYVPGETDDVAAEAAPVFGDAWMRGLGLALAGAVAVFAGAVAAARALRRRAGLARRARAPRPPGSRGRPRRQTGRRG